jgi:transposase
VVNLDETGWREENRKTWLWTGVAPQVSLFRVEASRSGAVVEKLLGEDFSGVAGSDRYGAYQRIPLQQRALCLAHIKRNFQALVDRGGAGARVGRWGLRELGRVFALWRQFRDGVIDRQGLRAGLQPIKARFAKLLDYGLWGEDHQAETLCWQLKERWEALWTFARVTGVEPTNNAAERALRPAVLWRKGSFGTQSQRGSRFAEEMLTVAASCRQQGRHLLSFLVEVCKATLLGKSPPSLVLSPAPP